MEISDADFADLKIGHAVTVQGGCLKKEELLETRRTRCGKTFVKLDKTAPWLSRVVTGEGPLRQAAIAHTHYRVHEGTTAQEPNRWRGTRSNGRPG